MAIAFHNQRVLDGAHADHSVFLKEKDGLSRRMVDCLKVTPSAMAQQLVEQRRSLLERCRGEMKEPEETLLTVLEEELTRKAETFLETYKERYRHHDTKQRAMDRARADHAAFLEKSNMFTSSEEFVAQRKQLLEQCRINMLPKTESALNAELMKEKEALLTKLEEELTRKDEQRIKAANEKFKNRMLGVGVGIAIGSGIGVVAKAAGAGVAKAAGAGVAKAAGAGVLTPAGAGVVAPAGAGVVEAAGARVLTPAGAGVVAPAVAGVVEAAGAGVLTVGAGLFAARLVARAGTSI